MNANNRIRMNLDATFIGIDSSGTIHLEGSTLWLNRRRACFQLPQKLESGQKLTITLQGTEPELFELFDIAEHEPARTKKFKVGGVVTTCSENPDNESLFEAVIRFNGHFTVVNKA